MAAKKRGKKPVTDDRHKGLQVPFRVDDPRLVAALDKYADRTRRSRNMAIIVLLEDALRAENLWPPVDPVPAAERRTRQRQHA